MYCEFFCLSFTSRMDYITYEYHWKGRWCDRCMKHYRSTTFQQTLLTSIPACSAGAPWKAVLTAPSWVTPLLSLQFVTPSASTALIPMTLGTILLRIPCWARGGDNQNQTYTEAPICHLLISTWSSCPHHFDKLLSLWISAKWPSGLTYPTWRPHTTPNHSPIQTPFLLN